MSEVKFKVGDLVYCPSETPEVCKIEFVGVDKLILNIKTSCKVYNDGTNAVNMPVILPATQENYELLSKLYPNVTFEPPPKRKEPKEVIKAMIKGGWKMIPCCDVNDDRENPPFGIHVISSSTFETVDTEKIIGKLIPFDPKTALEIIDFIDDKCVLENGEIVE